MMLAQRRLVCCQVILFPFSSYIVWSQGQVYPFRSGAGWPAVWADSAHQPYVTAFLSNNLPGSSPGTPLLSKLIPAGELSCPSCSQTWLHNGLFPGMVVAELGEWGDRTKQHPGALL